MNINLASCVLSSCVSSTLLHFLLHFAIVTKIMASYQRVHVSGKGVCVCLQGTLLTQAFQVQLHSSTNLQEPGKTTWLERQCHVFWAISKARQHAGGNLIRDSAYSWSHGTNICWVRTPRVQVPFGLQWKHQGIFEDYFDLAKAQILQIYRLSCWRSRGQHSGPRPVGSFDAKPVIKILAVGNQTFSLHTPTASLFVAIPRELDQVSVANKEKVVDSTDVSFHESTNRCHSHNRFPPVLWMLWMLTQQPIQEVWNMLKL